MAIAYDTPSDPSSVVEGNMLLLNPHPQFHLPERHFWITICILLYSTTSYLTATRCQNVHLINNGKQSVWYCNDNDGHRYINNWFISCTIFFFCNKKTPFTNCRQHFTLIVHFDDMQLLIQSLCAFPLRATDQVTTNLQFSPATNH